MTKRKVDKESCKNCRFCRNNECHKKSPRMTWPVYGATKDEFRKSFRPSFITSKHVVSGWPPVKDDEWCGEYQRRDNG